MSTHNNNSEPSSSSQPPSLGNEVNHTNHEHAELPFLVTHWLSSYTQQQERQGQCKSGEDDVDSQRKQQMDRIQRAAMELASAFGDIGAFGMATSNPLGQSTSKNNSNKPVLKHASYSDMARRWNDLPPNHLETIIQSSISNTNAVMTTNESSLPPLSKLDAAYERTDHIKAATAQSKRQQSPRSSRGRTIADAISVDDQENNSAVATTNTTTSADAIYGNDHDVVDARNHIFHAPTLLTAPSHNTTTAVTNLLSIHPPSSTIGTTTANTTSTSSSANISEQKSSLPTEQLTTLSIESDHNRMGILIAQAMRRYLTLRAKYLDEQRIMRDIQRSLFFQHRVKDYMTAEMDKILSTQSASASASFSSSMADNNTNSHRNRLITFADSTNPINRTDTTNTTPLYNKPQTDEFLDRKIQAERVIAQLGIKLQEVQSAHTQQTQKDMNMAQSVSQVLTNQASAIQKDYSDPTTLRLAPPVTSIPFHMSSSKLLGGGGNATNSILSHVIGRQYCAGVNLSRQSGIMRKRRTGRVPTSESLSQRRREILAKRLSHAVTVDCHLFYPVYCLRFDRTGRYFVTGADDQLVKIFRLGTSSIHSNYDRNGDGDGDATFNGLVGNTTSNWRQMSEKDIGGAVLVCTLRGHAGVITDIDVSSDNALLATASGDGDVRIWGMTNGCPVAILRGHKGGANMVSWSVMTPYRIVTTGSDGLARMWDIREAALKRCSTVVSREDYTLKKVQSDKGNNTEEASEGINVSAHDEDVALPPLPDRSVLESENDESVNIEGGAVERIDVENETNAAAANNEVNEGSRVMEIERANVGGPLQNENRPAIGSFVPNDDIDEGVKLLAKLEHGEIPSSDEIEGAGTRSRMKTVNVLCLTRCPVGGHFATGSDDGISRIWLDDDDERMDVLDTTMREENSKFEGESLTNLVPKVITDSLHRTRSCIRGDGSTIAPSKSRLLATLKGHLSSITDIQYSHEGDRLLTASQKDGNVRVWSWGSDLPKAGGESSKIDEPCQLGQLHQIVIKLVPPGTFDNDVGNNQPNRQRRRAVSSSSSLQVQCDVVQWTSDDSKIVTSQSCLVKSTDEDIVPGSHVIHVWDSFTGFCLLGLPSAHNSSCPVLVSHPIDSSILASAGGDGYIKVWNLNSGSCIFSHKNTLEHGASETHNDRGKVCAYLDGNFTPDGLSIVLTDDNGRITLVDAFQSEEIVKGSDMSKYNWRIAGGNVPENFGGEVMKIPKWIQEQYFSNDYYDLIYDSSGYCIESGSRQPPHLAPTGALSDHSGVPYPDAVQEMFKNRHGPAPISEYVVRLARDEIRRKSEFIRKNGGILAQNFQNKPSVISGYGADKSFDAKGMEASGPFFNMQMHGVGNISGSRTHPGVIQDGTNTSSSRRRTLSTNYRWRDDDDVVIDDDGREDDEDSDFEENQRSSMSPRNGNRRNQGTPGSGGSTSREGSRNSSTRSDRNRNSRNNRNNRRIQIREEVEEFEEVIANQPSRVSSRQQATNRRTYDVYGSSDESIIDEMLSRNTHPCGEFKDDYLDLQHIFKLPSNGVVMNAWATRTESIKGSCGLKSYSPQVGESVVYIPKAHWAVLTKFPPVSTTSSSAPWKMWNTPSAWPAVRCEVKDIRYRFPCIEHYKRGASRNISIVAILSLEVTGVPDSNLDHPFPWPKPEFMIRHNTRSAGPIQFNVSHFLNDECDFIVPEQLYTWRLKQIEEGITAQSNFDITQPQNLDIIQRFVKEQNKTNVEFDPDAEFDPYNAKLIRLKTGEGEEDDERHFQRSGFNQLTIRYDSGEESLACPWEIDVREVNDNKPLPTCLTASQKDACLQILNELLKNDDSYSLFSMAVNTDMYADYLQMIEVPMDLSIVRSRIESDFYTNVRSMRADIKLLKDNCLKYNESDSDISKAAVVLWREFEELYEEVMERVGYDPGERERTSPNPTQNHDANTNLVRRSARLSGESSSSRQEQDISNRSQEQSSNNSADDADVNPTQRRSRRMVNRRRYSSRERDVVNASQDFPMDHMEDDDELSTRSTNSSVINNNAALQARYESSESDESGEDESDSDSDSEEETKISVAKKPKDASTRLRLRLRNRTQTANSKNKSRNNNDIENLVASSDEANKAKESNGRRSLRLNKSEEKTPIQESEDEEDDDSSAMSVEKESRRVTTRARRQTRSSKVVVPIDRTPLKNSDNFEESSDDEAVESSDLESEPGNATRRSLRITRSREYAASTKVSGLMEEEEEAKQNGNATETATRRSLRSTRSRSVESQKSPSADTAIKLDGISQTGHGRRRALRTTRSRGNESSEDSEGCYNLMDEEGDEESQKIQSADTTPIELEARTRAGHGRRRSLRISRPSGNESSNNSEKFHSTVARSQSVDDDESNCQPQMKQEKRTPRSSRRHTSHVSGNQTPTQLNRTIRIRHSPRAARQNLNYCDSSDSDNSEIPQEIKSPPPKKRSRPESILASNELEPTPERRSTRARRQTQHSFESSALETSKTPPRSSKKKRTPPATTKKRRQETVKGSNQKKQKIVANTPELQEWPRNIVKETEEMRSLAYNILEKVEIIDERNWFQLPVLHNFPDMADAYLAIVEEPMDFTTIHDKIPTYDVISDLQLDLIKVFQNCCLYNKKGSDIYKYAVDCWSQINQVFLDALEEKGFDPPRRFKA